jgi:hypothetical protein
VKEKAEVAMQQTVSQSATSFATDKFLQNIVLHIDSIVLTSMSVPQVSEPKVDGQRESKTVDCAMLIGRTSDSSGYEPCVDRNHTRKSLPRNNATKVKVSGIRLQAITADSSSTATAVSGESNLQASDRSLAKNKEVNKPSSNNLRWLYLIIFISIAIAVILALLRYRSSIWSTVRFVLRKVIT